MYRQGLMAGDYYGRRNLAAGDPGLFGFLGRTLGGAIKGFIGGGPLGALTGAAKGALGQHPVLRQNPIGATLAPAAQMLHVLLEDHFNRHGVCLLSPSRRARAQSVGPA